MTDVFPFSIIIFLGWPTNDSYAHFSKAWNLWNDLEEEFGEDHFLFHGLGNGKYLVSFKNQKDAVKAKLMF